MGLIDVDAGLMYSGDDEDTYREILGIYINLMTEKKDVLVRDLEEGNIPDYIIQAHSVKSNSRSIGAMALGDLAEEMEHAAKENRIDYVKENNARLIRMIEASVEEAGKIEI